MSRKKNRIAKGIGASALAVATLASGLSFGSAAASAAPTEVKQTSAEASGTYKKLWGQFTNKAEANQKPQWWSISTVGSSSVSYVYQQTDAAFAEERAERFSTLSTEKWQLMKAESGLCFFSHREGYPPQLSKCGAAETDTSYWWKLDAEGRVINYRSGTDYLQNTVWKTRGTSPTNPAQGYIQKGKGGAPAEFGGDWNSIVGAKLEGAVEFGASVDARATVKGTTEANGTVEVRRGSTVIGTDTADANGAYSVQIAAPNKAGDDKLTVALVEGGADKKAIDVTATYGAGVAITGPADNADVMGPVTVTGTAQAGSTTTVKIDGGAAESVQVSPNGQWSKDITVPRGETKIAATSKSKGANTTTQTITLNPRESGIAPVALDAAFDAADEFGPAVLSGTGQPGAEVALRNTTTDKPVAAAKVDDDGNFSVKVPVSTIQYGENQFSAVQTVEGVETTDTASLDFGVAPTAPVIQTPSANAVVDPGKVSFAGTGQADAKVIIRGTNTAIPPLVSTTVRTDGSWSGASNRDLQGMQYKIFAIQTVKGGLEKTTDVTFTVRSEAAQDVTINAAFDAANEFAPATVSGRGEPGATVDVVNTSKDNTKVGSVKVGTDGRYSMTVDAKAAKYGENTFEATMKVGSKTSTAQAVLNYGAEPAAVEITSPRQNDVVSPNGLRFEGNGQADAKITIRGTNSAVGSTVVERDGTWRADVDRTLPALEYKLWADQTTKGGLTKQDDVTFRVQATALSLDAAFDAQNPLKPATVSGRGENGATVVVTNTTTNKEVGRTTIKDNTWSMTVAAKDATYGENTFKAVQTINNASTEKTATLNYGTAPVAPTVTKPASAGFTPKGTIEFEGTGTVGTRITVTGTNTSIPPIVDTEVQADGNWEQESTYLFDVHQEWMLWATVTTNGGLTMSTPFTFWTAP